MSPGGRCSSPDSIPYKTLAAIARALMAGVSHDQSAEQDCS